MVFSKLILIALLSISAILYSMDRESAAKRQKIDLNEQLIHAVSRDDIQKVQALLEAGANVHVKDNDNPIFMKAAWKGNKNIVELLLKYGANIDAQNVTGSTALMWLAADGRKDMTTFLLHYGANVNTQDSGGETALMLAIAYNHQEIIELLLKYKANVNVQDDWGDTALILATSRNFKGVVELLLNAGAYMLSKDHVGRTALELAKMRNYKEIEALLSTTASARQKLYKLREQVAQRYAALYPGTPVQEIVKFLT